MEIIDGHLPPAEKHVAGEPSHQLPPAETEVVTHL
jgi:hypothetical protein